MPIAIVHHANQYLITNGYDNREGLAEILTGFSCLFALHLKYRVPFNLHLSGTLIEAIAWHNPEFFGWITLLDHEDLLEIIGSAYSQNIMPLFGAEHNLRQINEALALYASHLGVDPQKIKTFWVPERVWNTEKLAPLIADTNLSNRGYRSVILDDRFGFPINHSYDGSVRKEFDDSFLLQPSGELVFAPLSTFDHLSPYKLTANSTLIVLPICRELRYVVPPQTEYQWHSLKHLLTKGSFTTESTLFLYADDLEKAVRTGSWGPRPWQIGFLQPYEEFLAWLSSNCDAEPVLINEWLGRTTINATRDVHYGTYFEIALNGHAGEDYTGWWESQRWFPYRQYLFRAENELLSAPVPVAYGELWDLAWKQYMACSYETAWHDPGLDGLWHSAPWAKALALHARSVLVVCKAARLAEQHLAGVWAENWDIDDDGFEEVVLYNSQLCAVFSPRYGGRLIYLFDLLRKRLVIGNPADDWHWHQEQNIYSKAPDNHPGALAEIGHENEPYRVDAISKQDNRVNVELVNLDEVSKLRGTRKRISLGSGSSNLCISYAFPPSVTYCRVEFALSPDYLSLLREGQKGVVLFKSDTVRGAQKGMSGVWLRKDRDQATFWDDAFSNSSGHCFKTKLVSYQAEFDMEIGIDFDAIDGKHVSATPPSTVVQ